MDKAKVLSELKKLFSEVEGINLSEEKIEVIAKVLETLAEGMVAEKLEESKRQLDKQKEEELREFIDKAISSIDETLDEYVSDYMAQNRKLLKRAVIKTNLTEMVRRIRGIVADFGIDMPSNKRIVQESQSRISELKSEVNKRISRIRSLKEQNKELVQALIIQELTQDLTASERDRIETLAENVEWSTPIQLKEKVEILITSILSENDERIPLREERNFGFSKKETKGSKMAKYLK